MDSGVQYIEEGAGNATHGKATLGRGNALHEHVRRGASSMCSSVENVPGAVENVPAGGGGKTRRVLVPGTASVGHKVSTEDEIGRSKVKLMRQSRKSSKLEKGRGLAGWCRHDHAAVGSRPLTTHFPFRRQGGKVRLLGV